MDLLDRVMPPATDLLGHVDDLLTRHGAPPAHPVWALMRRVGALPGDALAQVAALAPSEMRADAGPIAASEADVRTVVAQVPSILSGHGVAASAYASRWADLSGQIIDDHDGLTARLAATAHYLEDVAEWAASTRHTLAVEVGACLGSAQAVTVRAAIGSDLDPAVILAAADIAAHVLDPVARAIEAGWAVQQRWAEIRVRVPLRATTPITVDLTGHIEAR